MYVINDFCKNQYLRPSRRTLHLQTMQSQNKYPVVVVMDEMMLAANIQSHVFNTTTKFRYFT